VQTKKYELEESLKLMLKDDVISKKDYEAKMAQIANNVHLIEEAVADSNKMRELEHKLGIVSETLKEVVLMSDMAKVNPLEE
jgi:hypothetical protein